MADVTHIYGNEIVDAAARQDVNQLKEDISQVIDSAYVTDTASGSIASFPDGADNVPVKSLSVAIEPVQSGTGDPSPSNIRPISGHTHAVVTRCGKNLFDKSNTANILNNTDFSGATIGVGSQRCVVFIPCKPNRTYTASRKAVLTNDRFAIGYTTELPAVGVAVANVTLAPNSQTVGNLVSLSVTTGSDAKYVVVWAYWDNMTDALDDLQIELGSTATAYEPYNGQTYTIDLDGTRYGGTLNVETGVLTVDRAMVDMGTLNWVSENSEVSGLVRVDAMNMGMIYYSVPVCSKFKGVMPKSYTNIGESEICFSNAELYPLLRLKWSVLSGKTNAEIKAALTGVQLCYLLATPQTIQLTAQEVRTLLGQNNIYADTGDVDVEYRADTKLYIEKLTAPTEDDMIADHAISANSFFMVGNTLYRATTAIASGATITVGTNATKLSLSEALNALS